MAQVIRRTDGKVLFDGDVESGRQYVEQNFPRSHDPENPEVHLVDDDGDEFVYHDIWSDNQNNEPQFSFGEDTE